MSLKHQNPPNSLYLLTPSPHPSTLTNLSLSYFCEATEDKIFLVSSLDKRVQAYYTPYIFIKPVEIQALSHKSISFEWTLVAHTSDELFAYFSDSKRILFFKQVDTDNIQLLSILTFSTDTNVEPSQISFQGSTLLMIVEQYLYSWDVSKVIELQEYEDLDIGKGNLEIRVSQRTFIDKDYFFAGILFENSALLQSDSPFYDFL